MKYLLLPIYLVLALLAGCATTEPAVREVTVIKEVPVPYLAPCPRPEDKPAVPRRVAEEVPAMPALATGDPDWPAISRILGAKVLELFSYADQADAVMDACSKAKVP